MSYRKKHVKNKIHGIKPKKSIFKRLWFWILILFFIIILSAFYAVLFYSGFQVKDILVSGNEKTKALELQSIVLDNINTELVDFWKIRINSHSIFLVDLNKLNKNILEKFPVIEKIKINKNYPQTLALGIEERKPIGAFCGNDNECFLIDGNGIIFEPVSAIPDNLTVVRRTLESSQVFIGEEVVAQNMIDVVSKIQKNLKDNFQIGLKEALIKSSVRLNVETGENWQIYFDLDSGSDINLQLIKLNLLLNTEISQALRKNLYYIDLRPKDRAIICDNEICGG